MKRIVKILVFTYLVGWSCYGIAAGMRCGTRLVQPGDTFDEVVDDCGEPDSTYEVGTKYVELRNPRFRNRNVTYTQAILVDVWVYDLGSSHFRRRLYFENGILVYIENGERG